jgi:lipopolysaccharide transport system permease protein
MAVAPAQPIEQPVTVIEAAERSALVNVPELWRYRELLTFLAWRDIRVRYRQTLLGAAWALLEPLAAVIMFTLVFNGLAGIDSGSTPYPLFCYAAVLVWTFFGRALRAATSSLVANAGLVTKAYFPRLLLPLSSQVATLIDFACALLVFFALAAWFHSPLTWKMLTVPLWVGLAILNALGVGLTLAAINVRFRDVSQAVPFLTQVWMYASPVAYPLAVIPAVWRPIYTLNPLVGVVEGMRWALLPDYPYDPMLALPSLAFGAVLMLAGLTLFRHTQRRFADIV